MPRDLIEFPEGVPEQSEHIQISIGGDDNECQVIRRAMKLIQGRKIWYIYVQLFIENNIRDCFHKIEYKNHGDWYIINPSGNIKCGIARVHQDALV